MVTAEGGLVLELLLSWKIMCSPISLVVCVAPELGLDVLGLVTGALGPGEARGTEGSQFALVIGKETVFSGRWHWTEG